MGNRSSLIRLNLPNKKQNFRDDPISKTTWESLFCSLFFQNLEWIPIYFWAIVIQLQYEKMRNRGKLHIWFVFVQCKVFCRFPDFVSIFVLKYACPLPQLYEDSDIYGMWILNGSISSFWIKWVQFLIRFFTLFSFC